LNDDNIGGNDTGNDGDNKADVENADDATEVVKGKRGVTVAEKDGTDDANELDVSVTAVDIDVVDVTLGVRVNDGTVGDNAIDVVSSATVDSEADDDKDEENDAVLSVIPTDDIDDVGNRTSVVVGTSIEVGLAIVTGVAKITLVENTLDVGGLTVRVGVGNGVDI
jgi:hypothetical protein